MSLLKLNNTNFINHLQTHLFARLWVDRAPLMLLQFEIRQAPPASTAGQITPSNLYSVNGVVVTVGSVPVTASATALSPGSAGLYQVVIQVPSSLANGDYPIVATVGGVQSPSGVKLTVQQ